MEARSFVGSALTQWIIEVVAGSQEHSRSVQALRHWVLAIGDLVKTLWRERFVALITGCILVGPIMNGFALRRLRGEDIYFAFGGW